MPLKYNCLSEPAGNKAGDEETEIGRREMGGVGVRGDELVWHSGGIGSHATDGGDMTTVWACMLLPDGMPLSAAAAAHRLLPLIHSQPWPVQKAEHRVINLMERSSESAALFRSPISMPLNALNGRSIMTCRRHATCLPPHH